MFKWSLLQIKSVISNSTRHLFSTSKSFDNLFFEGKQALIDRLNFFLNNPNFYQQRGIAHSLGLLFYGTPGKFTLMSFEGKTKKTPCNISTNALTGRILSKKMSRMFRKKIESSRLRKNIDDQSNRFVH